MDSRGVICLEGYVGAWWSFGAVRWLVVDSDYVEPAELVVVRKGQIVSRDEFTNVAREA
jgi:hypothetical protein